MKKRVCMLDKKKDSSLLSPRARSDYRASQRTFQSSSSRSCVRPFIPQPPRLLHHLLHPCPSSSAGSDRPYPTAGPSWPRPRRATSLCARTPCSPPLPPAPAPPLLAHQVGQHRPSSLAKRAPLLAPGSSGLML
jgi:hypothetical protein